MKEEKFEKVVECEKDFPSLSLIYLMLLIPILIDFSRFTQETSTIVTLSIISGFMFAWFIRSFYNYWDNREVYWRKV